MRDAKQFWDRSAARYAKSSIRDQAGYEKKLAITREYFRPDWSVLEFGCGTGSTAILHAPFVGHIVATDISDRMLEIARQKAEAASIDNVIFRQGTLDSLEFEPESFDAVLGLNILHLLEEVEGAISTVYGLLKPGGVFISSTALVGELNILWRAVIPLMQAVGLAPFVNRFRRGELVAMLEQSGFSIDREWQPGKGSLFIVARK
ncbi:methyltransferase domain-containing protein [Marinobacterium sp. D7]|uniref:class I SAM-dependent methyltransferase n=1 Tax=Marinobacterium ramblicola TaxID=2849041 RepID=UPI001C2D2815|nr:class I SAM-dependent methyltransferase [Marinobacterium ramblicola]MBV1789845.1 methyltransferase domain-containing protein [Marinobacterium ramblicola]